MSTFDSKEVSAAFYQNLMSDDQTMVKSAMSAADDYIRMKLREGSIVRKIMNAETITYADCDPQVDTDKPCIIVEKEPESPAAYTLNFGSLPVSDTIYGRRFRIVLDRIATPRMSKDAELLGLYNMDIRQIITDNMIKDLLAEEDGKFLGAVNRLMVGPNQIVGVTDQVQWFKPGVSIGKESYADSMKVLPNMDASFEPATILLNSVTVKEFYKWDRDAVGGDLAQEITVNGWGERVWNNVKHLITIKNNLVPNGTVHQFVDPKAFGKFYILTDVTMHVKREAHMLDFYAWETIGGGIGNVAGCARIDFEITNPFSKMDFQGNVPTP